MFENRTDPGDAPASAVGFAMPKSKKAGEHPGKRRLGLARADRGYHSRARQSGHLVTFDLLGK
jgi:hypothetical protein